MQISHSRPPSALDWARWWPAPAKLNLFLHIFGRREDGYHELETVFQLLDLHDNLKFSARDDGNIVRIEGDESIAADTDLVVKAANALRTYMLEKPQSKNKSPKNSASAYGVSISCRKRIPIEAGMGGGSSDAATTLLVLNHLWECGLELDELLQLSLSLGADVPVFVHGHTAYARGVGEKLQALELNKEPREQWFLIIKPQVSVSTQKIFTHSGLTRGTDPLTIHRFLRQLKGSVDSLPGHNDCQKVVCEDFPEIQQVVDWLGNFGEARLTGTGSAVFLKCDNENAAKAIWDQVSFTEHALSWQALIAKGLDKSPLCGIFAEMQRV